MKTLMMRCLSAVALLLLYANASAQSLRCPSPLPPLNVQNGIPVSPVNLISQEQIFYWVIREEVTLDSFNMQINGNAITLNVYLYNLGQDMMLPPNCMQVPIGFLPAGAYTLTINEYHRFTPQLQYPSTPTLSGTRPLIVAASSNSVPTLNSIHSLILILLACAVSAHFFRSSRS